MIKLSSDDIFLFQGDSITHGGRGQSLTDMNHIIGHGFQSHLAGRMGFENIESNPLILNRGVSGDTTAKLLVRWQTDTLDLQPTVLNLLVGINDSYFGGEKAAENYRKNLDKLFDMTVAALPDIKLIICEPFAFERVSYDNEEHRQTVLKNIEICKDCALYAKQSAEKYNAVFVPFYAEMKHYVDSCAPAQIVWDGVHPTIIGHEIMSRFWYETVDKSGLLR